MKTYLLIALGVFTGINALAQSSVYYFNEDFKKEEAGIPVPYFINGENYSKNGTALNGSWSEDFTVPGIIGTVITSATDGTNMYFGGRFNVAGGTHARSLVKWDGQNWSSVGEGAENGVSMKLPGDVPSVEAIAIADGKLFVGGQFPMAGSLEANGIAYWDGTKWNTLGDGELNGVRRYIIIGNDTTIIRGYVYELFAHQNKIYVGGLFNFAGDKPANGIAIWNMESESWESPEGGFMGETISDPVHALAFAANGDSIYVGGIFQSAGGIPMQHIALWDGTTWSRMGDSAGFIVDMDIDSKGNLYAVGYFPAHEAPSTSGIGIWDGSGWESLEAPQGLDAHVNRIKVHGNTVYAAGSFKVEQSGEVTPLAKWENGSWELITGLGVASNELISANVQDMELLNGKLYLHGTLTRAGENYVVYVAAWDTDGKKWMSLDDGSMNMGIHDGYVNATAKGSDGIYAGGSFAVAGGVFARNVAKLSDKGWESLGAEYENGIRGEVYCMAAYGDSLFVGGHFGSAGTREAYHIAWWDGSEWHSVGIGVGGVPGAFVNALAKVGDYLYAGGYFSVVGDSENYELPANSIARYNLITNRWETIGNGIENYEGFPGIVNHLEVSGNQIMVVGQFNIADRRPFQNVAILTNNKWSGFEENEDIGVPGVVRVIKKINNKIYIGGRLFPGASVESKGMMQWDGKAWAEMEHGFYSSSGNSYVLDIKPLNDGFIVSGNFRSIGETEMNNIAYFDGMEWHSIGNGVLPMVSSFEISGRQLYVGGVQAMYAGENVAAGFTSFLFDDPGTSSPITDNAYDDLNFRIYPNPFKSSATLQFRINNPGNVYITLWDMQGNLLRTLLKEYKATGEHQFKFSADMLPNGIYIARILFDDKADSFPVVIMR